MRQARPSILGTLFVGLTLIVPALRPVMWRLLYNEMAARDHYGDLLFMNYGYAEAEDALVFDLLPHEQQFRYHIQLYLNTVRGLTLTDKNILEVGCGRGGGGAFLLRTLKPHSYTGVDLSERAIRSNQAAHPALNAEWKQGAADVLPIPDESMDIVLNVESSHCYPSMPKFLAEVRRVLRPGGSFAFCDLRLTKELPLLEADFAKSGLTLRTQRVITTEVLRGLDELSKQRETQIQEHVPGLLQAAFRDFAALQHTIMYDKFRAGELVYVCAQLIKPGL